MRTAPGELNRWLNAPREGENLEFKEAKNQYDIDKLFRYCVAVGVAPFGLAQTPRKDGDIWFPPFSGVAPRSATGRQRRTEYGTKTERGSSAEDPICPARQALAIW
jgi:hypothetical protein